MENVVRSMASHSLLCLRRRSVRVRLLARCRLCEDGVYRAELTNYVRKGDRVKDRMCFWGSAQRASAHLGGQIWGSPPQMVDQGPWPARSPAGQKNARQIGSRSVDHDFKQRLWRQLTSLRRDAGVPLYRRWWRAVERLTRATECRPWWGRALIAVQAWHRRVARRPSTVVGKCSTTAAGCVAGGEGGRGVQGGPAEAHKSCRLPEEGSGGLGRSVVAPAAGDLAGWRASAPEWVCHAHAREHGRPATPTAVEGGVRHRPARSAQGGRALHIPRTARTVLDPVVQSLRMGGT